MHQSTLTVTSEILNILVVTSEVFNLRKLVEAKKSKSNMKSFINNIIFAAFYKVRFHSEFLRINGFIKLADTVCIVVLCY